MPAAARRRALGVLGALPVLALAGCAGPRGPAGDWTARLRGDTVALLGETHDNAEQHRRRLAVLRRAVAAGWRPTLAMEQFDTDRQADIDRARAERPRDADHLIAQATTLPSGWDWSLYRPVIALALDAGLPLRAANLSRRRAGQLVRHGYDAVFDAARRRELGLDGGLPAALQPAQQRAVNLGHCGVLPAHLLPGMARAQIARDAVMADTLRRHAAQGVVLLAGNGHVRRDLGVPRWLDGLAPGRVLAVGYLEDDVAPALAAHFDAVVVTPPAAREDPCARLQRRHPRRPPAAHLLEA